MTLATLVLLGIFVSLGRWQWQRGEGKQAVWAEYQRESEPAPLARATDTLPRFTRVSVTGHYEAGRQFLLDNRSHQGRPGYEVLTPFVTEGGRWLLVNRGWIPYTGYRDQLPEVGLQPGPSTTIVGRLEELPAAGLASGRAPPNTTTTWPRLTSFPTHAELAEALGEPLEPRQLLLDPQAPQGYVREWTPPGLDPSRHFSYAIQWWGFAAVLLVLYFGLNFRKVNS